MKFTIPVFEQPIVGQKQEFTIKGEVLSVETDPNNHTHFLATIDVPDAQADSEQNGFSPMRSPKSLRLREEIRGG